MEYKKFINNEIRMGLKFWDEEKVELKEFTPEGSDRVIRFFRKKVNEQGAPYSQWDKEAKIISRSGFSNFRDPFIVDPWTQILVDDANIYGSMVDDNLEQYLEGKIDGSSLMMESKLSLAKVSQQHNLIWVGRSEMVCHPESLIYGEVDEIWYDEANDEYIVGDTKTSSSVNKIGYWYQLGIYIEILRQLNPDKKFSAIGYINWARIKDKKRKMNDNICPWSFCTPDSCKQQAKYDRELAPEHGPKTFLCEAKLRQLNEQGKLEEFIKEQMMKEQPFEYSEQEVKDYIYNLKWKEFEDIEPETINQMVTRDIERDGILNQVIDDLNLIKEFKISSVDVFTELLNKDPKFEFVNSTLQRSYDEIKSLIEIQEKDERTNN